PRDQRGDGARGGRVVGTRQVLEARRERPRPPRSPGEGPRAGGKLRREEQLEPPHGGPTIALVTGLLEQRQEKPDHPWRDVVVERRPVGDRAEPDRRRRPMNRNLREPAARAELERQQQ